LATGERQRAHAAAPLRVDRRIAQRPQTAEPTGIRATATEAGRAPRGWEVLGKPTRRGRDRRAAREGTLIIDMRRHYTAADGKLRPTSKGLALTIAKLPELAAALARAEQRARELGLLGDGESAS